MNILSIIIIYIIYCVYKMLFVDSMNYECNKGYVLGLLKGDII